MSKSITSIYKLKSIVSLFLILFLFYSCKSSRFEKAPVHNGNYEMNKHVSKIIPKLVVNTFDEKKNRIPASITINKIIFSSKVQKGIILPIEIGLEKGTYEIKIFFIGKQSLDIKKSK